MNQTISIYQEVSAITDRMLAAARNNDWESLAELEQQCSGRIDILRANEATPPLSAFDRQLKIGVIRKILDDDRQIRAIISPWMDQLSALINSSGAQRKLSQTYGMNSTG